MQSAGGGKKEKGRKTMANKLNPTGIQNKSKAKHNPDSYLPKACKGYRNSPVIGDNGITATEDEISNITRFTLAISQLPDINFGDPEQIIARTKEYLNLCATYKLRPGNLGLYAAWGVEANTVSKYLNQHAGETDNEKVTAIKKGKQMMALYRESLMANGKLNPVTGIFWQKNFDGMKDTQEVVLTPNNPLGESVNPEQIASNISQYDDDSIDV